MRAWVCVKNLSKKYLFDDSLASTLYNFFGYASTIDFRMTDLNGPDDLGLVGQTFLIVEAVDGGRHDVLQVDRLVVALNGIILKIKRTL